MVAPNGDLIRDGVASVESGGRTVTGSGVVWSRVRDGDTFGAHRGLAVPIEANAAGVLTLAYDWPGPTQVNAPYAIQLKGDTTRFAPLVRELLETLSSGSVLDGLAGHISDHDNPHEVTADQVGMGTVLNRSLFPEDFVAVVGADGVGGLSTRDDTAAMQAAINAAQISGAPLSLKPRQTYYFSGAGSLVYDPSRLTLLGNSAIFNFSGKSFTDPATSPELATNAGFDSSAGWIASGNTTLAPVFEGSQLRFTPPEGVNNYLEIGQLVVAPTGSRIRVTMEVGEIVSHTVGQSTFRDVGISFRKNTGSAAGSIAAGGQAGGSTWFFGNNASDYAPGAVVTRDFVVTEANPYVRIQTNAVIKLNSFSVKVIPNNVCILCRVPEASQGGMLRGHNYREWRNLKMVGKPGEATFVELVYFDTPVYPVGDLGQQSRVNWYNIDISDGVGKALIFNNRTYLSNFFGCRFVCAEACVETIPGSHDAGENIAFFGGNLGGGKIGILNRGGFEIGLFGTSIDFSRQWYVGGGDFYMSGCHLETNAPTVAGYPLIDVTGGLTQIRGTKLQVNGSTVPVLTAPFRVAAGGFLDIESKTPYNLHGTTDALCEGDGRFRFVAAGGLGKEMDAVGKRDDRHNRLGAGGRFQGSSITVNTWISGGAQQRNVGRYKVEYPTGSSFAGTVARGSNLITGVTATPQVGWVITLPGFPAGTTVSGFNATTQTVTVTSAFQSAGGLKDVTFEFASPASAVMELSTAQHRSGAQSLRIAKGANVGSSTLIANFAIPITPPHAAGAEWWWKIPPAGSGTTAIYFQTSLVRLTNDGGVIPIISDSEFVSDLPQTGINRSVGSDWSRLTSSTLRVPIDAAHDGHLAWGATHFLIALNLTSTPSSFEIFIADMHGTEF